MPGGNYLLFRKINLSSNRFFPFGSELYPRSHFRVGSFWRVGFPFPEPRCSLPDIFNGQGSAAVAQPPWGIRLLPRSPDAPRSPIRIRVRNFSHFVFRGRRRMQVYLRFERRRGRFFAGVHWSFGMHAVGADVLILGGIYRVQ